MRIFVAGATGGGTSSSQKEITAWMTPTTGSSHGRVRLSGQRAATPAAASGTKIRSNSFIREAQSVSACRACRIRVESGPR